MKLVKFKLIITSLVGIIACSGLVLVPTHADTPASSSSSANASITVSNTINLTLTGGDLVIDNLTPGNASDSNIITATITSNSPYGYHLSATTGTSTGTTSLVNTADSNFSFANLSANKATLNDFSDNTWGYSYSTDNGTSWISGDYGTALTGYNGLILDNDDSGATGTTLYNNDSYAGSTSVKFKIGAKSATTQAAGTYTGTVNFYAVTNPKPTPEMQNLSASECTSTMSQAIDNRDGTLYNIQRLDDGNCWLLDNLALDLTNSTVLGGMNENNTHASNTTIGYLKGATTRDPSADPNGKYATAGVIKWTSGFSYSIPAAKLTDKDVIPSDATGQAGGYKVGGYYNYCAASAGSYCYGNGTSAGTSTGNATEDICPKGWRMPTGNTTGEYSALANAIYGSTGSTTEVTAYTNYRVALHLPLSGFYYNGMADNRGVNGYGRSSTWFNLEGMYCLYASMNRNRIQPAYSSSRGDGFPVRCVLAD